MPTKNQTYHHGNLREALLEAAIELLNDNGVGAIKMREIGRIVGVSQSAAYRHFSDKSALLAAIAEQGFNSLANHLHAIREDDARPAFERLEQMGRSYVAFAVANAAQYRLMYGHDAVRQDEHPTLAEASRNMSREVYQMVRICQQAGQIRGDEPRPIVHTIWSAAHGTAMLLMDGFLDVDNAEAVATQLVQHVSLGIKRQSE